METQQQLITVTMDIVTYNKLIDLYNKDLKHKEYGKNYYHAKVKPTKVKPVVPTPIFYVQPPAQ